MSNSICVHIGTNEFGLRIDYQDSQHLDTKAKIQHALESRVQEYRDLLNYPEPAKDHAYLAELYDLIIALKHTISSLETAAPFHKNKKKASSA